MCKAEAADVVATSTGAWRLWRIVLPDEPDDEVEEWLAALGHPAAPPTWELHTVTPPRFFRESNAPGYFCTDTVLINLAPPTGTSPASQGLTLVVGSSLYSSVVSLDEATTTTLAVAVRAPAVAELQIRAEREAGVELAFAPSPSREALLRRLQALPRLRVQIGETTFESAKGGSRTLERRSNARDVVAVEASGICLDLIVWRRRGRRVLRNLDEDAAAEAIAVAVADRTTCELDVEAGALGRLRIVVEDAKQGSVAPARLRSARWLACVGLAGRSLPGHVALAASRHAAPCAQLLMSANRRVRGKGK